jgi:hypothetical protein
MLIVCDPPRNAVAINFVWGRANPSRDRYYGPEGWRVAQSRGIVHYQPGDVPLIGAVVLPRHAVLLPTQFLVSKGETHWEFRQEESFAIFHFRRPERLVTSLDPPATWDPPPDFDGPYPASLQNALLEVFPGVSLVTDPHGAGPWGSQGTSLKNEEPSGRPRVVAWQFDLTRCRLTPDTSRIRVEFWADSFHD